MKTIQYILIATLAILTISTEAIADKQNKNNEQQKNHVFKEPEKHNYNYNYNYNNQNNYNNEHPHWNPNASPNAHKNKQYNNNYNYQNNYQRDNGIIVTPDSIRIPSVTITQ